MKQFLFVLLLCSIPAIVGCESIEKKADAATYTALAKEYVEFVSASDKLTKDQKERRYRTVYSWGYRGHYDVSFVPYKPGGGE